MEKGLVKSGMNLPGFVENAYESVEAMEKFAKLLLDSQLCPDHFYEKKQEGNKKITDYTKGKTSSVVIVLLQGHQLQLPPLTALQHIIPVNGLLSVKGDAAKSMIFGSGKLRKDSWHEEEVGEIGNGTYAVRITATRDDNGQTLTRSFSVEDAKRAGLWITQSMLSGQDGWKYKKSAWYKYPARMINYRALGFIARDLFPDVMAGIYTTEEAVDMPKDETLVIETTGGAEAIIPDKSFAQERSENLTSRAVGKIDKRNGPQDPPPDIVKNPLTPEESFQAEMEVKPEDMEIKKHDPTKMARELVGTMLNGTEGSLQVYDEEELKEMEVDFLHELIESDGLMTKARDIDPSKNTNKKLRNIILAKYAGDVVSLIEKFDPEDGSPPKQENVPEPPENDPEGGIPDQDPPQGEEPPPPQDPPVEDRVDSNKFDIEIPDLVDGKRGFEQVKALFEEMTNVAGVDNRAFETLITTKFPEFQKYRTKEDFCYKAEKVEINRLLNEINSLLNSEG